MHSMERDPHSDADLRKIYLLKNIAVVGTSKNEEKPGHFVPKYLIEHGYDVIPVNPKVTEVLGRKSYPSIADIGEAEFMLITNYHLDKTSLV
jgi:uncharacterized protein